MTLGYRLAMVALALVLAVLSWRYVETPFRKRLVCARRPAMFAFGAAGIALVLAVGSTAVLMHGFPTRYSPAALAFANTKDDKWGIHELSAQDIRANNLVIIGNQDPQAPVSLLLWGDSHAMAAAPAFDKFLRENGQAGRQATHSATAPVLGAYWQSPFTNQKEVIAFNDAVFAYIARLKIPRVVLVGNWEYYTDARGTVPFETALLYTIKRLVATGTHPYILLQVPHPQFDVPKALAMASCFSRDLTPFLARPTAWNSVHGEGSIFLKQIESEGGHIIDPRPLFMDYTNSHYIVEKNGVSLYRDQGHLSATGAKMMLVPLLR